MDETAHTHFFEIGVTSFGRPPETRHHIEEYLVVALHNLFGERSTLEYVATERVYPSIDKSAHPSVTEKE